MVEKKREEEGLKKKTDKNTMDKGLRWIEFARKKEWRREVKGGEGRGGKADALGG